MGPNSKWTAQQRCGAEYVHFSTALKPDNLTRKHQLGRFQSAQVQVNLPCICRLGAVPWNTPPNRPV